MSTAWSSTPSGALLLLLSRTGSMPITVYPFSKSRRARLLPTKPDTPVIKIFFMVVSCWLLVVSHDLREPPSPIQNIEEMHKPRKRALPRHQFSYLDALPRFRFKLIHIVP